jgi:hypothetical protein
MMGEPRRRPLPLGGHEEGGRGELCAQVVAHGPPHDLAARQVEHSRQVPPALAGRHVGDVGEPDLVRGRGREALLQEVGRDRQAVAAVGGAGPEAARGGGVDAMPA